MKYPDADRVRSPGAPDCAGADVPRMEDDAASGPDLNSSSGAGIREGTMGNPRMGQAHAASPKRRLILCFDGTWNTPESQTNVSRLYSALADAHSGCPDQLKFYDQGVGTEFGQFLRGGIRGDGLVDNILQGYAWLVGQYESGDEIFLFGFSRGAFTARSLAGLINRCDVVRRSALPADCVGEAKVSGCALVKDAWAKYRIKAPPGQPGRALPAVAAFRAENSWDVRIKLVAVWDTVGALGIPTTVPIPAGLRGDYSFHDTGLGQIVETALHAVAIDEHREDYGAVLWTDRLEGQRVEQRWFPGAHTNVGGGYEDDLLPDPPLHWIASEAAKLGVEFLGPKGAVPGATSCAAELPPNFGLTGTEYLSPVRDSYQEFLAGAYSAYMRARGVVRYFLRKAYKIDGRHYRPMLVAGVAEAVDETANQKWQADQEYRPPNLASAGRTTSAGPRRER